MKKFILFLSFEHLLEHDRGFFADDAGEFVEVGRADAVERAEVVEEFRAREVAHSRYFVELRGDEGFVVYGGGE